MVNGECRRKSWFNEFASTSRLDIVFFIILVPTENLVW